MSAELAARLAAVRARLDRAAERAGRDASGVVLVAVSKRHPATAVDSAFAAGQLDFGENYAQELAEKRAQARCGDSARWHFIGRLQRNKVKLVVGIASLIHAVDSERLATAIDKRARELSLVQRVLIAVNTGGEEQKSGVAPDDVRGLVEVVDQLASVRCEGLMTMPPWPEHAEDSRPHYRAVRELRDQLSRPDRPLWELSMGTTGDMEVAVEEGATLVRVGTAVFGSRA